MSDAAVLVASCDTYADLWKPFFTLFDKHWPDCPFPVFLGSNYTRYRREKVISICVGQDVSWADNLHKMLDHIPSRRVILFLEDFLMVSPVDTRAVQHFLSIAQEEDLACLRLFPHPPPTRKLRGWPGLGVLRPGDDYRVSTQVAIWDAETLKALAWPGLSAWDFEIIGSLASNEMPAKFWSVYEPVIDYRNGVWRGRWLLEGLEICTRAAIELDMQARGAFGPGEFSGMSSRSYTGLARSLFPASLLHWRRRMLRRRLGRSYMRRLLDEAGLDTSHVDRLGGPQRRLRSAWRRCQKRGW
jgi:hypothetical protein